MIEEKLPEWLSIIKENIPEIKNLTADIKNSGIADIERGLVKVRYGESVENDLGYLSSIFLNNTVEQYCEDEQVNSYGSMLGGTIINLANETSRMHIMCSTEWNNEDNNQLH